MRRDAFVEKGFVIEAGEDWNPRRRIDVDSILLQREDVANLAERIEKEVTVAQFRRGHFILILALSCCRQPPPSSLLRQRPCSERRSSRDEQLLFAVEHIGDG